jgi:exodeoxyribonuclease V beta subunit
MSLAHLNAGVTVQQIGQVLNSMISDTDILKPYAQQLSHDSFNIPLAGLINGSIDALLRISTNGNEPRLYITDYKSNRLDRDGDARVIDGYTTDRMCTEMMHHHYPLQALIYGAAVHRFLRWRAPHLDPDASIGGIAYFFIRAMVGPDTPVDEHGNVRGVFTWEAPSGLWQRLSDLMAGVTL